MNSLANALSSGFGSSNAQWIGSNARTQCQNYYNAFPGKDYIKTVSKGTNTEYNTASLVYNDETVWLPSIFEVGLGSYTYAPKAAEYTSGITTPYPYYANNGSRIKTKGDSSKSSYSNEYWWTRSRYSNISNRVCNVDSEGSAYYYAYSSTGGGLAPAFVIG